jgi:hypothetical protein
MADRASFETVSLEPSPTIEAYKRDVDRTLIRENLRLTPDERLRKMIAVLGFAEEVRKTRVALHPKNLERSGELEAIQGELEK